MAEKLNPSAPGYVQTPPDFAAGCDDISTDKLARNPKLTLLPAINRIKSLL
jgi:hypothetical protein